MRILPLTLLIALTTLACGDKSDDSGGSGADGADGADGTDGSDGADGTDGTDGADGTDGTGPVDQDGDGFPETDDCDDTDADIFPGAPEQCNDIDDNCDGAVDEGVMLTFYSDADHDGYGLDGSDILSCVTPPDTASVAGDCDDEDDTVYPGAEEICYDNQINDCGATLADAMAACPLGGAVGAEYLNVEVVGEQGYTQAGASVSISGDLNGDGLDDLLVGAPRYASSEGPEGAAYVVLGGTAGPLDLASAAATFHTTNQSQRLGTSVDIVSDLDGDGNADLVLGGPGDAYSNGGAWIFSGPVAGAYTPADAVAVFSNGLRGREGAAVAGVGDVNGDGYGDLLVGMPDYVDDGLPGRTYLLLGPTTGALGVSDTEATFYRGFGSGRSGASVDGAGDLDGDGLSDLLIGAPTHGSGGSVSVILGDDATGVANLDTVSSLLIAGSEANAEFGFAVANAGDVDGDGVDDILVGARYASAASSYGGQAKVFSGTLRGGQDAGSAMLTLNGEQGSGLAGSAVAGAGDLNGDGLAELLVGAPGWTGDEASDSGRAYVVLGGSTGTVGLDGAAGVISGTNNRDRLGSALAGGGDLNGDGIPDVAIGADETDGGGYQSGGAYLLFGARGW